MSSVAELATELEGCRIALEDIVAGIGTCSVCGVEHEAGYEGHCQEQGGAFENRAEWSWVCPGIVSLRNTAAKALKT